jgi:isochorismate hydrolase
MKETYFTTENLEAQSKELLDSLAHLRKDRPFNPGSAALLVLDMQRYFLAEDSHAFIPSAPAILPNIKRLQHTFLEAHRPVIQTRHINSLQDAGQMKTWWKRLITAGTPHSHLVPQLRHHQVIPLVKSQYDAFYRTNLEALLREKKIEQVVITGVMTHLCCETTARSAFVRGFEVFFTIDATATYNREFHRAALLNLSHGFTVSVPAKEILYAFQAEKPGEKS